MIVKSSAASSVPSSTSTLFKPTLILPSPSSYQKSSRQASSESSGSWQTASSSLLWPEYATRLSKPRARIITFDNAHTDEREDDEELQMASDETEALFYQHSSSSSDGLEMNDADEEAFNALSLMITDYWTSPSSSTSSNTDNDSHDDGKNDASTSTAAPSLFHHPLCFLPLEFGSNAPSFGALQRVESVYALFAEAIAQKRSMVHFVLFQHHLTSTKFSIFQ
jgi:hypothetical protein